MILRLLPAERRTDPLEPVAVFLIPSNLEVRKEALDSFNEFNPMFEEFVSLDDYAYSTAADLRSGGHRRREMLI